MPNENIEETTTVEPSTARKVTAAVIPAVVTIVVGVAVAAVTEKLNTQIRNKILKTDA